MPISTFAKLPIPIKTLAKDAKDAKDIKSLRKTFLLAKDKKCCERREILAKDKKDEYCYERRVGARCACLYFWDGVTLTVRWRALPLLIEKGSACRTPTTYTL